MKPVILTGDLNCAHEEIDIFNPAVSSIVKYCSFKDQKAAITSIVMIRCKSLIHVHANPSRSYLVFRDTNIEIFTFNN